MEKKKGKEKDAEEEEECGDKLNGLEITIPQLTGDAKVIRLLKSSETVKNLGLFAMPNGCSNEHISQMKDKMEDWTVRVAKWRVANALSITTTNYGQD